MKINAIITKLQSFKLLNLYATLFAIVAGLLSGLIILLIINPAQAFPAFSTLLFAGFSNGLTSIGNVIYYATPIILTGLSIAFAFKTGLFNIGATGQLLVGGYIALFIGIRGTIFGPFAWLIGVIAAAIAGGLWAFIPALMKVTRNVHEVVTTIMMNYIALYLVNYLVKNTIYNPLKNESLPVPRNGVIPKFGLDLLFRGSNVQGGFILAILLIILVYFILNKTVFGFELKAVGLNKESSRYAGINEKRRSIQSLMIAGAIAGVAGAVIYLSDSMTFLVVQNVLPSQGFMGISVALLGLNHPIGVLLSGLFFGYLTIGGQKMQLFGLAPQVIDVITGMIVYFSALSFVFSKFAIKLFKIRKEGEEK